MRLVFDREEPKDRWSSDVAEIVEACSKAGYEISRMDARAAWDRFSDSMDASWMTLPDDPVEIVETVLLYCTVVED